MRALSATAEFVGLAAVTAILVVISLPGLVLMAVVASVVAAVQEVTRG